MKQQRAVVVGAGVVGTVTAEALWNAGYQVTVIEQNTQAALGTSAANAGQLCGPFCLPFAAPGFVPMFVKKTLAGLGVGARPADVLGHIGWGLQFMQNCNLEAYRRNAEQMLRLAHESVAALDALLLRHDVEFAFRKNCGKLYLYDSASALSAQTQVLDLRRENGFDVHVLSKNECLDIEPALNASRLDFAGGIYATDSSLGDCALFTRNLAGILQDKGVSFQYGQAVEALRHGQSRVQGVSVGGTAIDADVVVLTTATGTKGVLPNALRSRYPIAPIKGYSVTLPVRGGVPKGSVTDAKRAVAVSVLGDALRITGGAYMSSSMAAEPKALQRILDVARDWFPDAADYDAITDTGWAGLRPVSPNSMPYIGSTSLPGLYINTGHGGFGWTLAAASAQRVMAAVTGR